MTKLGEMLMMDGYEKGIEEGMKEGMKKGMKKGLEKGLEIGFYHRLCKVIQKKLAKNIPIEEIAEAVEEPIEVVEACIRDIQHTGTPSSASSTVSSATPSE